MLDLLSDRLIDQATFVDKVGIDPKTARHWERRGFGPKVARVGRAVLYDLREVENFLATRGAV